MDGWFGSAVRYVVWEGMDGGPVASLLSLYGPYYLGWPGVSVDGGMLPVSYDLH